MSWLAGWLDERAAERERAGLDRVLRPRGVIDGVLDLASNDYLGLARDPRVIDGAVRAARRWGAGSTGSRLVTGDTTVHHELEDELAAFCGADSALVFSSGYTANLAVVSALGGPGSVIVSDALVHASLVDACRLARAEVVISPHADPDALDAALAGALAGAGAGRRALVLVDAVGSADGDVLPLARLHAAGRRHGAVLVIDDAHGFGVCGAGGVGAVAGAGLIGEPDVITTMTLSKSLGSQGGAVLGPAALRAHLVAAARSFVFDTGLAPACAGAALAALRVLRAEPGRAARVLANAEVLAAACGIVASGSAVLPVLLGRPEVAVAAAAACLDAGVRVGCFRPPTVPAGTSRLRITARAGLSAGELATAADVLGRVLAAVRQPAGSR